MVKLGYINNAAHSNVAELNVIKEDTSDDTGFDLKYNKLGSCSRTIDSRIKTNVEFDFLDDDSKAKIKTVMMNSKYPKIYMRFPAATSQFQNFVGLTSPSATHKILYTDSDNANLNYGGTEVASYANVQDIDGSNISASTNAHTYEYMFFRFYLSGVDYSDTLIKRISLFVHNPMCCQNGSYQSGVIFSAYNQTENTWLELSRLNYTGDNYSSGKFLQHYAVLKPKPSFTNFSDYTASGYIYFRMRSLEPRNVDVRIQLDYVELLIDGWPVSMTNQMSLDCRDNITFNGRTGSLELSEI